MAPHAMKFGPLAFTSRAYRSKRPAGWRQHASQHARDLITNAIQINGVDLEMMARLKINKLMSVFIIAIGIVYFDLYVDWSFAIYLQYR